MRAAFSMIAVLAATLALSATVAVADPAKPWQIDDVANAPWQATFVDSFYDCDANETVFTYSVAANAEADLGHWIVAAPDCSGADLVNDQEWEYATDPVTGLTGFLWSWGQELSTERMYRVRLTGKVGVDAAASYGVSGGSRYAIGTVLGPVCGGDESYPETEKADEVTPDCTESIPTAFPEGCTDPDCYELVDSDTTHPLCQSEPVIVQTFRKEIEADGLTWATQVKRTVKFDDSEAPTWDEAVPADRTYECDLADSIPDAAALSVVDNCGFDDGETVSSIEACEKVTNTSCPQHYYIVRSWTAVDECGNERCATQTITVTDTNPPTFDGVEEDKHLACADVSADPSLLDDPVVTASDSCSDDVLFEEHKTRIADECTNTFLIRRTYKATDECGNTDHASQLVTVFDDVPPVLTYNTSVEDTRTVECREIPEPMEVTAFDECADASVEVNYTQTPENPDALPCPDRCRVHVERKWTACDDCGNTVELKRDIIVLDRTAPTFTLAAEADVTVQCDAVPDQRDEPVDDACDDSITMAECTETRTNTSCENEYVLNRTCTATDCCGNSVSRTRIITVVDEQITCPAAPGDLNVKCTDIPDHTELAMPEQACSADATQTLREDAYEESCSYDIVRHWDFKDCAGNECSVSQTISVVDDIKPVFDECPTDKSVFCTLPEAETLTGTDNCNDTVTVTSNDENDVECPGRQTTVRTWTADDGCGNTETCVQTINVYDNEAPEWTSFPDDLELNCQDDVPVVAPTASDACSAVTVVQVADETTENGCKNNYTRVISWTATDECGNVLGPRNQTIVVRDNESPVLDNKPADQTDECSEISCPEDVFASDNCDGLDLDYTQTREEVASPSCDGIYELHRTWTATDDCGHVDTHTQVITVQDSNPPVYNGPELTDMYVPCDQDIVLPTEPKFEWTDLCSEVEEVFPTNTTRQTPMQCANNLTTVVTWTASDECGNTASVSKTYFIFDKIDPVVEQLDDQTIECDVDFTPTTPEYSDSCGNVDLDTTEETEDLDCVDTGYLSKTVYTHTATDACGNTATTQNTVSVTDSDAPVMVCPEAEISATCCDVPDPAVLTATDNCAATQDIEAVTTRQDGPCVNTYNLTHVWTATDACGNTATCTQVVVIKDEEAPQLEGVPTTDATASCEDVPKPEKVCASDNCVGVDLNFTEERHTETCDGGNYTLTRTWTATDACGHATTQGYDLVVTDEVDPTWNTDLPESSSVECDKGARDPSTPPTVTQPGCEDTCASVTVTPDHSQDEQGCPQDINFNYEWTCEDACGNSIEHSITIEQRDTTKPTFGWSGAAPVDASYKCELPEAETPSGHDSCSTGTVSYEATPTVNASCPIQVTEVREWTVTDECGNADTHTVTVTVDAPAAPTWDFAPADSTIGCKDDAPIAPALTATDDCGNNVTDIVFEEKQENHGCTELIATPTEYDIVRTWTATDQCGQVIVYTQTIFVRDQAPPTITPPAPRVQKDKCAMDTTLTGAIGSDDCYFEVTTTEQDINTPRACPYEWHMEYTFTATDNCGKSASAVVVEEYEYTLLPTVVDEDSITTLRKANCHNVSLTPDVIEWQDGCNNALGQGTVETTTEPGSCPNDYVLVWTYSITDSCGLSNTFVIRTHVFDKTPPVLHFEWPVEDQTVECPFVPPAPEATATDTCGGDVTIEFVEFKVGFDDTDVDADCCNYDLYRVWRATDACNNTATMTQKVTVQDTIPPRWNGSSIEDVIVECPEDVERPNITWFEAPFASGYCPASTDSTACTADDTASFEFVLNGVEYSLSSARFIKWVNGFAFLTGTASSAGPEADLEVNFQFNLGSVSSSDGLAQAINADTLEDSCYGPDGVVLAQWVFFEELQGNLTNVDTTDVYEVSGTKYLQLGLGATGRNELYGLRTTFAANIGGVETAGEIALQLDTCDTSDWGFPELECGPEITATEDEIFVEGSCPGEWVRTYIWNATDSAGNKNSTTMKVTSHDNTDPVWTVTPPSTASGVCADPAVPNAEAEDTCSDVEVSLVSSPREPGSRKCDFHYSFVRTWTAVDECGNDIETEQHVSVEDNVDPELTITGEPDEKEYECVGDLPAAATFSCSDNCDSTSASNVVTCQGPDVVPTDSNCSQIVTYNYLAVDACGNQDSHTYSVLVNDAKAPQCTENCAAETTEIDCSVVPEEQTVTFVDNCEGETVVSPVRTVSDGDFCPKTYTDTYNLVDNCGNHAAEIVKVYLAYDKTAPTITVPANRTVTNCADALTPTGEEEIASGAASASDDCAVAGVTVTFVRDEEVYEGDCLVLVIRHWESVDDCGNKSTAKSYIIVDDQSAPTFEPASIDSQILECDETIPCPETVSINDNCDGVHLSFSETEEAGACPQERVITRTWTGLDACGNTDQLSYTITVQDTTKPEFVGDLPTGGTYECSAPDNSAADVTVTDNCDGAPTVVYTVDTTPGSCAYDFVELRKWNVTDACGNWRVHEITVTVQDTQDPFAADLDDIVHECDSKVDPLPLFGVPVFSDNCGDVTVTNSTATVDGDCDGNYTVTRTWVGTDECGNDYTVDQKLTVQDTTAPTLEQPEAELSAECQEEPASSLAYSDNCGIAGPLDFVETSVPDSASCSHPYTVSRTWTATDDCGHVTTAAQEVRVTDTLAPEFVWAAGFAPEDFTTQCTSEEAVPVVFAFDECKGNLTDDISYVSTTDGDACRSTETRKWTVCDCSENCISFNYTITYIDDIKPVFDAVPEAGPFVCGDDVVSLIPDATASDPDCTGKTFTVSPSLSFVDGGCDHNYTIVADYSVTDDCGNTETTQASFEHYDITAPEITGDFSNVTIECDEDVQNVLFECSDNCDDGDSGITSDVIDEELDDGDDCDQTKLIKQTYFCQDSCGHRTEATRFVHIVDTTAPEWETVKQPERDYECDEDLPVEEPTATDKCHAVVVTRLDDTIVDGDCPNSYTVTHNWRATDQCNGLFIETSQTYNVVDTSKPVLSGCPADITAECDDVPCPATVTATDSCPGVNLTFAVTRVDGDCDSNYTLTRTWTATDACGNTESCSQTVTVQDTSKPTFEGDLPTDDEYDCTEDVPDMAELPTADNCGKVTQETNETRTDTDCGAYSLLRRWDIEDECGNTESHEQTITVTDERPPIAEEETCICLEPLLNASHASYANPTSLVSFGADACGDASLDITVDSCRSAQDAELGLDEFDGGFTADCHLVDGVLKIRMRASYLHDHGRLFNVTFKGTDGCGNSEYASHYVWVPLNQDSDFATGFPEVAGDDNVDTTGCSDSCITVTPPSFCAECECRYGVEACEPDGTVASTLVLESQTYNSTTGETALVYQVSANSADADQLTTLLIAMNLDANDIEVIGVSSDGSPLSYVLGFGEFSYYSGLLIEDLGLFADGSAKEVTVTLRGDYAPAAPVSFNLANQELCSNGMTAAPGARTNSDGTICGSVGVYGTLLDGHQYDDQRVPLSGVTVALRNGADEDISSTVTGADGTFCFGFLTAGDSYSVYLPSSGFFSEKGRGFLDRSNEFLVPDVAVDALFPHGEPQDATVPASGLEFKMYLNNVHFVEGTPVFYNDGLQNDADTDYFRGNSRSAGFWLAQLRAVQDDDNSEHCPLRPFLPLAQTRAFAALADTKLSASCGFGATGTVEERLIAALSAGGNHAKLLTATLNHIAGHGVLEPYRLLQGLVLDYAHREVCEGGVDPTVGALLDELLGAH